MAKKRVRLLVTAGISAAALIALLLPGYTKLQDIITKNSRMEKKIEELGETIEDLRAEKERLENDILYIEKVAREKLGVVRKDEIVIKEKP